MNKNNKLTDQAIKKLIGLRKSATSPSSQSSTFQSSSPLIGAKSSPQKPREPSYPRSQLRVNTRGVTQTEPPRVTKAFELTDKKSVPSFSNELQSPTSFSPRGSSITSATVIAKSLDRKTPSSSRNRVSSLPLQPVDSLRERGLSEPSMTKRSILQLLPVSEKPISPPPVAVRTTTLTPPKPIGIQTLTGFPIQKKNF